jgi:hypothetical protein
MNPTLPVYTTAIYDSTRNILKLVPRLELSATSVEGSQRHPVLRARGCPSAAQAT